MPDQQPFTWDHMDKHVDTKLEPVHGKIEQLHETLKSAVPRGDFDGHRKAHEALIQDIEDRKRFFKDLIKDVLKWVLNGVLLVIAGIIALGVQSQFSIWVNKSVDVPRAVPQVSTPQQTGSTK